MSAYLPWNAPRRYKTGDRVAYDENEGTIVGRADDGINSYTGRPIERWVVRWGNGVVRTVWASDLSPALPKGG